MLKAGVLRQFSFLFSCCQNHFQISVFQPLIASHHMSTTRRGIAKKKITHARISLIPPYWSGGIWSRCEGDQFTSAKSLQSADPVLEAKWILMELHSLESSHCRPLEKLSWKCRLVRRETKGRKPSCQLMSLHQTSCNLGVLESREAERNRRLEIQLVQSEGADDANNMSNDVRLLSCLWSGWLVPKVMTTAGFQHRLFFKDENIYFDKCACFPRPLGISPRRTASTFRRCVRRAKPSDSLWCRLYKTFRCFRI